MLKNEKTRKLGMPRADRLAAYSGERVGRRRPGKTHAWSAACVIVRCASRGRQSLMRLPPLCVCARSLAPVRSTPFPVRLPLQLSLTPRLPRRLPRPRATGITPSAGTGAAPRSAFKSSACGDASLGGGSAWFGRRDGVIYFRAAGVWSVSYWRVMLYGLRCRASPAVCTPASLAKISTQIQ